MSILNAVSNLMSKGLIFEACTIRNDGKISKKDWKALCIQYGYEDYINL